jgi:cobalt/nickel transport protein
MRGMKKLWWGLLVLILISPCGLILPEVFKSGPAWGEWGLPEVERMLGYIPEGFKKVANFWAAPVPDYSLKIWQGRGLAGMSLGYIFSAGMGVGIIVLAAFLLGKLLSKKNRR